jgi:hypothetical protein
LTTGEDIPNSLLGFRADVGRDRLVGEVLDLERGGDVLQEVLLLAGTVAVDLLLAGPMALQDTVGIGPHEGPVCQTGAPGCTL